MSTTCLGYNKKKNTDNGCVEYYATVKYLAYWQDTHTVSHSANLLQCIYITPITYLNKLNTYLTVTCHFFWAHILSLLRDKNYWLAFTISGPGELTFKANCKVCPVHLRYLGNISQVHISHFSSSIARFMLLALSCAAYGHSHWLREIDYEQCWQPLS